MSSASTSLYRVNAIEVPQDAGPGGPTPPGTVYTASIETIDNDRADLLLELGIIR